MIPVTLPAESGIENTESACTKRLSENESTAEKEGNVQNSQIWLNLREKMKLTIGPDLSSMQIDTQPLQVNARWLKLSTSII